MTDEVCEYCGKNICECELDSPIVTSVKRCHNILDSAKKHNMELEVVVWALEAMRINPGLLPEQALMEGYNEWIK